MDSDVTEANEQSMVKKADKIFEKLNREKAGSINSIAIEDKTVTQNLESLLDVKFEKLCNSIASISFNKENRSRKSQYENSTDNSNKARFVSRERSKSRDRSQNRPQHANRYYRNRSHDK